MPMASLIAPRSPSSFSRASSQSPIETHADGRQLRARIETLVACSGLSFRANWQRRSRNLVVTAHRRSLPRRSQDQIAPHCQRRSQASGFAKAFLNNRGQTTLSEDVAMRKQDSRLRVAVLRHVLRLLVACKATGEATIRARRSPLPTISNSTGSSSRCISTMMNAITCRTSTPSIRGRMRRSRFSMALC